MQILIAAQGVTPNSVEINTNCILPATASPTGSPTFACKEHYFGSPSRHETFMKRVFLLCPCSNGYAIVFSTGLPDRHNNISPGISKYGDTKSYIFMQQITGVKVSLRAIAVKMLRRFMLI